MEETITIKKTEFKRLIEENKTLRKELDNREEPTEFLGKKASEWIALKDLIEVILRYQGRSLNFENLSARNIKNELQRTAFDYQKLKNLERTILDISIMIENLDKIENLEEKQNNEFEQ